MTRPAATTKGSRTGDGENRFAAFVCGSGLSSWSTPALMFIVTLEETPAGASAPASTTASACAPAGSLPETGLASAIGPLRVHGIDHRRLRPAFRLEGLDHAPGRQRRARPPPPAPGQATSGGSFNGAQDELLAMLAEIKGGPEPEPGPSLDP